MNNFKPLFYVFYFKQYFFMGNKECYGIGGKIITKHYKKTTKAKNR